MAASRRRREVPAYNVTELSPRTSRYCICIPVINEGSRISRQLLRMQAEASGIDIAIADGGSSDGSVDPHALAPRNVRALLTKTGPGRLSAQMRMAIDWALKQGYEGVVFMDGNNKDDPSDVQGFVSALDEGFDHVQGSRFMAGGVHRNTPLPRLLAIRLLHAPAISLAAGFRYTDTTNGFRAYSRRLLADPAVAPLREEFSGYELHYYLAIRAPRLGYRTIEIPVTRTYPESQKAPTKISPIRGNLQVVLALMRASFHRFDPGQTRRERGDD